MIIVMFSGCGTTIQSKSINKDISAENKGEISGNVEENTNSEIIVNDNDKSIDKSETIDLTELSSTMVYSEVYNMMMVPEEYIGKTVIMKGQFDSYEDENSKIRYFSCIITDATECCSQGLEFVLAGNHSYPNDYPAEGDEIIVKGVFQVKNEDGYNYICLENASFKG